MGDVESQLRGLVLSAIEIKNLTGWASPMVEDYLNIVNNFITIADELETEINKTIEATPTDFTDGSIPFANSGFLTEDNVNLFWDNTLKLLKLTSTQLDNLTANRLAYSDATKKVVSVVDLTDWIAGTANEIIATDDGDGTMTLALYSGSVETTTRVTTTYTILVTDNVVFCDTDGGSFTVTLPAGVEGQHFKVINCGADTLTVDTNGTEELYGAGAGVASTLASGEVIDIHYNATEGWF